MYSEITFTGKKIRRILLCPLYRLREFGVHSQPEEPVRATGVIQSLNASSTTKMRAILQKAVFLLKQRIGV